MVTAAKGQFRVGNGTRVNFHEPYQGLGLGLRGLNVNREARIELRICMILLGWPDDDRESRFKALKN